MNRHSLSGCTAAYNAHVVIKASYTILSAFGATTWDAGAYFIVSVERS